MINEIQLKHYKAFEDVKLPLRPITILLGANSVGKSALIQMLLMLQQTGKEGLKSYKSALKLYGGDINLGDPQNIFRKKDVSKPLGISFSIKSKIIKEELSKTLHQRYISTFQDLPMYYPLSSFQDVRGKEIESEKIFLMYLDAMEQFYSREVQERFKRDVRGFLRHRSIVNLTNINKGNKKQYFEVYEFLDSLTKKIKTESFQINYQISYIDNTLQTTFISIYHAGIKLFEISNNPDTISVSSDLIHFTSVEVSQINNIYITENTIFNTFSELELNPEYSPKVQIIYKLINLFQEHLKDEFSSRKINYVSPLRAHPKRYYMLDKAKMNISIDTLDGDAVAEVLKDKADIKKKVNVWLKRFDLSVDVEEFKEVIHHLTVKQNNLDLDITDVGFGISQILPVIIQGFLSPQNSTTIIEQPEIHLHPKMQADLADLFIDIVKTTSEKKLLIETHSEYILKRLRRRISEGKISPNKVAICLIDPQTKKNGAIVKQLEIEENGFFEWPIDFYGGELYNDISEYLKNQ